MALNPCPSWTTAWSQLVFFLSEYHNFSPTVGLFSSVTPKISLVISNFFLCNYFSLFSLLPAWYCIDIIGRNSVLVTLGSERIKFHALDWGCTVTSPDQFTKSRKKGELLYENVPLISLYSEIWGNYWKRNWKHSTTKLRHVRSQLLS